MNEIIKEFREDFETKIGSKKTCEDIEQFILTKLKEERIKTLEEIEAHVKTKMWHELSCPAHCLNMKKESDCDCQMAFVLDLINNLKN